VPLRRHPVEGGDAGSGFGVPNFEGPIERAGNDSLRLLRDAGHGVGVALQGLHVDAGAEGPDLQPPEKL